jgi:transcriptional regulator with XRE-family HTH domain
MTGTRTLAETVNDLRKQRGLRQSDLARQANLSPSYVNEICGGLKVNLSAKTRDQLARALNVQPDALGDVA